MHKLLFLIIILLLAACSAGTPTPTGTPLASTSAPLEPTDTALEPTDTTLESTATPTDAADEPTAARPAEPLPAPLYTLDQGQIFRIERDGLTRTRLTDETTEIDGYPPIATFAVNNVGALAYIVGDLEADRLVITAPDGTDPNVRYSEVSHELSDLAWTPDGAGLVLRLLNNRQPPDTPSGVYRIDLDTGALELLVPDDPVDNLVNPAPEVAAYRPFAWSPDGTHLLVEVYSPFYFTCGLGFLPAAGGTVTRIALPEGTETFCGEATWAPDSRSVLFMAGPESGPTIWRADVAAGAAEPLGPNVGLARAPLALADDEARVLAVELDPAGNPSFTLFAFTDPANPLQRLRSATNDRPAIMLWSPTGEGAVALLESPENQISLRWLPADDTESVSLPATRNGVTELRWGE